MEHLSVAEMNNALYALYKDAYDNWSTVYRIVDPEYGAHATPYCKCCVEGALKKIVDEDPTKLGHLKIESRGVEAFFTQFARCGECKGMLRFQIPSWAMNDVVQNLAEVIMRDEEDMSPLTPETAFDLDSIVFNLRYMDQSTPEKLAAFQANNLVFLNWVNRRLNPEIPKSGFTMEKRAPRTL